MTRGSRSGGWNNFPPGRLDLLRIEIRWSMIGTVRRVASRAGFVGWIIRLSRSLPLTARIWDARFDGFHNQISSCVPVTAELITKTDRVPLDLPNAVCSSTATKLRMGNF